MQVLWRGLKFQGDMILSDLKTWPELKTELNDFIAELKEYQKEQFEVWTNEYTDQIDSGTLSLETDRQVVYFEQGKNMRVRTFSRTSGKIPVNKTDKVTVY